MQSGGRDDVRNRMAESRLVCEREVAIQERKIDSSYTSYRNLLDSALSKTQKTIQSQEKLGNLKGELKEAEDAMVKAVSAYKEKLNHNSEHRDQIEDAISWYNKVLGFRIECGRGVKFVFTNINPENPNEEYSFDVRHENERYTKLVSELNNSNGLFKFVRTIRVKFQEAAARGMIEVEFLSERLLIKTLQQFPSLPQWLQILLIRVIITSKAKGAPLW